MKGVDSPDFLTLILIIVAIIVFSFLFIQFAGDLFKSDTCRQFVSQNMDRIFSDVRNSKGEPKYAVTFSEDCVRSISVETDPSVGDYLSVDFGSDNVVNYPELSNADGSIKYDIELRGSSAGGRYCVSIFPAENRIILESGDTEC